MFQSFQLVQQRLPKIFIHRQNGRIFWLKQVAPSRTARAIEDNVTAKLSTTAKRIPEPRCKNQNWIFFCQIKTHTLRAFQPFKLDCEFFDWEQIRDSRFLPSLKNILLNSGIFQIVFGRALFDVFWFLNTFLFTYILKKTFSKLNGSNSVCTNTRTHEYIYILAWWAL